MKNQKKQLNNVLKLFGLFVLVFGLSGAKKLPIETPTDAPFRIKKIYEPKNRAPASFQQEVIPQATPVPAPEKSQFPWLFRFSSKSTR